METGWTREDVDYREDSVEARIDVEPMTSGGGAAAVAANEGDQVPLAAAELDSLVRFVAGIRWLHEYSSGSLGNGSAGLR